jgi:hypothetical protein
VSSSFSQRFQTGLLRSVGWATEKKTPSAAARGEKEEGAEDEDGEEASHSPEADAARTAGGANGGSSPGATPATPAWDASTSSPVFSAQQGAGEREEEDQKNDEDADADGAAVEAAAALAPPEVTMDDGSHRLQSMVLACIASVMRFPDLRAHVAFVAGGGGGGGRLSDIRRSIGRGGGGLEALSPLTEFGEDNLTGLIYSVSHGEVDSDASVEAMRVLALVAEDREVASCLSQLAPGGRGLQQLMEVVAWVLSPGVSNPRLKAAACAAVGAMCPHGLVARQAVVQSGGLSQVGLSPSLPLPLSLSVSLSQLTIVNHCHRSCV